MKRKILSILLVLSMALTLLPTAVLAEGVTASGGNESGNVAAVPAASEEVITLNNNETYILSDDTVATVIVPSGVNATLNLNGKKLSNANGGKATLSVEGTATVKGGTIIGGSSNYNIEVKAGGSLTLENVTATAGNNGSSMIDNWGTLTIESGTYTGGLNVVKNEPGGTLTINNGEFELLTGSSGFTGVVFNYGTLEIADGTFKQSSANSKYHGAQVIHTDKDKNSSTNPSTTINGGTFINSDSDGTAWTIRSTNAATPYTKVTAGKFNKSVNASYLPNGYATTKKDGYYVLETAIMSITLDQTEVRLKVGESITLNAVSTTPEDAAITTWTIYAKSGGSYVTTSSHKITGKAIGDAVIIARPAGAGSTPAECIVHVYDEAAQIGEEKYPTFEKALESAKENDTIALLKNVSLKTTAAIDKSITLDLGGYTLTGPKTTVKSGSTSWTEYIALKITAGTVNIKNGKISGRVNVYDAANVTIESNAIITNKGFNSSTDGYGIVVWGDGTYGQEGCKTPVLNLYGKVNVTGTKGVAISTNGTDASKPVINIYDGAEVTSAKCSGIYLPSGALTVSGGTITGATGIYFKSTDMTISGGTVVGNGPYAKYEFYGNGANATGDAVVIDNCNYPNGIGKVELTGGNFKSDNADAVGSYAGNGQTDPLKGFITGGTFNKNPNSEYLAAGYCVKNDGTFVVGAHDLKTVEAKAATCTEPGNNLYYTCEHCGVVYKADHETVTTVEDETLAINPTNHAIETIEASDATCTTNGNLKYYHCTRCGKYYSDDEFKFETTVEDMEIPAHHTEVIDAAVAANCTEAGKTEGKHCSVCKTVLVAQEEVPALGHDYDENGICTRCDAKKPVEEETGLFYVLFNDELVIHLEGDLPAATGEYRFEFTGDSVERIVDLSDYDGSDYSIAGLFSGPEDSGTTTYTSLKLQDKQGDSKTDLLTTDKTLTVQYGVGEAVAIKELVNEKNDNGKWNVFIKLDGEFDENDWFAVYAYTLTSEGERNIAWTDKVTSLKDGRLETSLPLDSNRNGVMFDVQKVTGAVDEEGNATLTFTPLGEGKQWTAPADSGNTGGNTGGSTSGSSSSGSTTTKTETTTNPDGSTTKTETKADGTTVETTTNTDGSTTTTETKTETKADGSTVETKSETSTAADGSKTESKTETTTAPDGSKTETKTETKTAADGTKTETEAKTETKADGTTTSTETSKTTDVNGSTGTTTTTTENGNTKTEAEAKISEKAVEDAKQSGEAVKVPTEVKAGESSNSAPTVKIELPENAGETKVEIPVSNVNSGTVAVIVNEDGTEEIVKDSTVTENGVVLGVEGSTTVKIIDNSKTFIDTENHWSRDEVNFVASRELFNGIGGNLFGVSGDMTRGMVNTVLARLAGEDTNGGANWYDKGTEWAKKNGITDGTNPTANVTREQLAAMLYRFAGSPEVSGELSFADADRVSDYAKDALLWAVQNGILNGIGNNLVAPPAGAERAQVAAMMARYLKNVG